MKVKKEIPVDQSIIDAVSKKYPGIPFTRWAEMAFREKLDNDNSDNIPQNGNDQLRILIADYNKLKISYREFKDEVDNRLITLETRLK
jgi:hypothetical protein